MENSDTSDEYLGILTILSVHAGIAERLRQVVHVDTAVAVEVEALEQPLQPLLVLGRQLVQVVRRRRLDDRARRRRRAYTRTAAVPRHM